MKSTCRFRPAATTLLLLSLIFIWGCATSHDSRSIEQKVRYRILSAGKKEALQEAGKSDKEYLIPLYMALEQKQHNQAIALAGNLQSAHPHDADLYYIQGVAYFEQNDLTTALRYFEKTIETDSNRGDAYYYQALMLYKLGQTDKSLDSINTAIENVETSFQLMNQEKLRLSGNWTTEGRRGHLFFLRASINNTLRKKDDALSDVNRAISLSPYKSAAYFKLRGQLYFYEKSELSLAYSDLQQAAELDPKDGDVRELLGLIDTYRGRYDEAVINYRNAISLEPDRLNEALGYAAVAYWLRGDRAAALEAMGKAIRKKPDYNIYYHLGYFHHLLGNHSQARENFKRAEQLNAGTLKIKLFILTRQVPRDSPSYTFYAHEYEIASKYLGTGKTAAVNSSKSRTPALQITDLILDPDPVRVNQSL